MTAHVPVKLARVLELIAPVVEAVADGRAVVVDATLGLGGHAEAILDRFASVRLIGIDRDASAIAAAEDRLERFGDRVRLVHAVYDELSDVARELGLTTVDVVLFDLGVSSMQLDEAGRGFAYSQAAALDMRMNRDDRLTAAEVLNTYSAPELVRILRQYGEEKFATRIVERIVARREVRPFDTNQSLLQIVEEAIPAAARRRGGHPAKRTFQALRIEVNDELNVYRRALPDALDLVAVGGRVIVLAYHSLEDRITKQAFSAVTKTNAPRDLPVVPVELQPDFVAVTRGAELADEAEIETNRRAKPVRLRAVEKVAA